MRRERERCICQPGILASNMRNRLKTGILLFLSDINVSKSMKTLGERSGAEYQAELLRTSSTVVRDAWKGGKVEVESGVYDLASGKGMVK
jgi:carbonic anhydrase